MYLRVEHSIAGFTILQLALAAVEGGLFFFTLITESVNRIKLSVSIINTNTSNTVTSYGKTHMKYRTSSPFLNLYLSSVLSEFLYMPNDSKSCSEEVKHVLSTLGSVTMISVCLKQTEIRPRS